MVAWCILTVNLHYLTHYYQLIFVFYTICCLASFSTGTKDKCQFAFIHWKNLTVVERQATHEGQVFQLKTENHNYLSEVTMLQEQNQALQSQLVSEKEKNMIESSRANTLQRKLKEFEVAKIMAVQTSVDKPAVLKKKTPVNDFETEEQMMDIVLKRIEGQLVDPVSTSMRVLCLYVDNVT